MKINIAAMILLAFAAASGLALAGADDAKWINQCIKDNKDEGAKDEVVRKYCECMNNKMDESETRSITEWEKKNPKARKDCEKQAGWK